MSGHRCHEGPAPTFGHALVCPTGEHPTGWQHMGGPHELPCDVCGTEPAPQPRERQTWERRIVGTDVAEQRMHLEVDDEGRVRVHEALLAQLLVDAGWERTA